MHGHVRGLGADRSYEHLRAHAAGDTVRGDVQTVLVNGRLVKHNGKATGRRFALHLGSAREQA